MNLNEDCCTEMFDALNCCCQPLPARDVSWQMMYSRKVQIVGLYTSCSNFSGCQSAMLVRNARHDAKVLTALWTVWTR